MSFLSDAINSVQNAGQGLISAGKGLIEDVSSWCSNLISDVSVGISSLFDGDVVGINANKVPDMIGAIEEYIKRIDAHLKDIKENTTTEKAMKGEYADAVKAYVGTACEICYRITSQLRYFEDKLKMVAEAYQKKDENLSSSISSTANEMNSSWQEYKGQNG